jgi:tetratricopeptide (TPR) repeat protein
MGIGEHFSAKLCPLSLLFHFSAFYICERSLFSVRSASMPITSDCQEYYEVLQVSPNADREVIQAAYSRLVDKWHAQRRPGDRTAFERLTLLDEAFAVLSNPEERQEYDSRRRQALPIGEAKLESPQAAPPQSTTENSLTSETKEEAEKIQAVAEMSLRTADLRKVVPDERIREEETKREESERLSREQERGIVTPAAKAIFALGIFFFLASQQLNFANFLLRASVSCLIFGIPFICFSRFGSRTGISFIAILFCLATGIDFAWVMRKSFTPPVEPVKFQYQPIISDTTIATNSKLLAPAELVTRNSESGPSTRENANKVSELILRGQAWNEKKEYDKAVKDFTEAIRLDPTHADAYNGRGDAWKEKKEHDKAIIDYTEAIRLNPSFSFYYSDRGDSWRAKHEYDKAIADYSEAIRLKPNEWFYKKRGDVWRAKEEYDIAIRDYDEAIRLDPKVDTFYSNRGYAWFYKRNYEKAIADFTEVIRLDPQDGDAYRMRGQSWSDKQDYDKAIRDFNDAIRLDPKDWNSYRERGSAWQHKQEYDKAIEDYETAIPLSPKQVPLALNDLALLLAASPDWRFRDGKRAIELATKACERMAWKDGMFLETLAAAYAEDGQFDVAVRYELKASQDPRLGDYYRQRLELYKQKKPYRLRP